MFGAFLVLVEGVLPDQVIEAASQGVFVQTDALLGHEILLLISIHSDQIFDVD